MIQSCQRGSQWQRLFPLLSQMCEASVLPDVILFNSVINSCQEWTLALQLLEELRCLCQPDLATFVALKTCPWHAAISLMKARSLRSRAFESQEIPKHAVRHATVGCNALMTKLVSAEAWQEPLGAAERRWPRTSGRVCYIFGILWLSKTSPRRRLKAFFIEVLNEVL